MHTFMIILAVVLCASAICLLVCYVNDGNLTPVGKVCSSVFVACIAVILSLQVMIDYPDQTDYLAPRLATVAPEQYAGQVQRHQAAPVELPASVVEPSTPAAAPGVATAVTPGVAPVAAAPVAAPAAHEDSTLKDMALGGALGYLAGSAGRGNGVTSHTTVIHEPAPSYSPPPSRPFAPAARPAPRPVVAAAPRPTFKNTFSLTRSRR